MVERTECNKFTNATCLNCPVEPKIYKAWKKDGNTWGDKTQEVVDKNCPKKIAPDLPIS